MTPSNPLVHPSSSAYMATPLHLLATKHFSLLSCHERPNVNVKASLLSLLQKSEGEGETLVVP